MLFLAYTHWNRGMPWRSFALSKTMKMKTKPTMAVIGASGDMGSAIST